LASDEAAVKSRRVTGGAAVLKFSSTTRCEIVSRAAGRLKVVEEADGETRLGWREAGPKQEVQNLSGICPNFKIQ